MTRRRPVPTVAEMEAIDAQRRAAAAYHEAICAHCGQMRNMHTKVSVSPSQLNDDLWVCPTSSFQEKA